MSEGRYELKYAVPVARRDALLRLAWDHVKPDTNADNLVEVLPDLRDPDGEPPFGYRVCSLYVDDAHLDGYAQRLDSRRIRNRLRIRSYGWNGTTAPVFFEAKRKLDDQVIKHRVKVCSTATWATLPGRHPWREAADTTTPKASVLAQRCVLCLLLSLSLTFNRCRVHRRLQGADASWSTDAPLSAGSWTSTAPSTPSAVSPAEDDDMSSVSSIRESGGSLEGESAAQRPHASSFYNEVYAFVANQFGSEPVPRGIVKTFADPE